jgi:hypothetical protein
LNLKANLASPNIYWNNWYIKAMVGCT